MAGLFVASMVLAGSLTNTSGRSAASFMADEFSAAGDFIFVYDLRWLQMYYLFIILGAISFAGIKVCLI